LVAAGVVRLINDKKVDVLEPFADLCRVPKSLATTSTLNGGDHNFVVTIEFATPDLTDGGNGAPADPCNGLLSESGIRYHD
jgi:hypothetical protein